MALIVTNAWLGTAWGDKFRDALIRFYRLRIVVLSGAGRWFRESDVVTTLLVLERRHGFVAPEDMDEEVTRFVVLQRRLEEYDAPDASSLCAAQIEMGDSRRDEITIRSVTYRDQREFRSLGLGGSAQFVDCEWVRNLPIVPLRELFVVRRGERRGWDAMFYPSPGHGIESEYIRPVLKSPADIDSLITSAHSEAFCCSHSLGELERLHHAGALAWVRRFAMEVNKTGRPLPESLARAGRYWYEMRDDQLAELVIPIGIGERIYVSRLLAPAFVNQRLVALSRYDERVDLELSHALLNSAVAMFMIEGMGFGRGLGVLDLNKTRFQDVMHILNPQALDAPQSDRVKAAFRPLLDRPIRDVADELADVQRQAFDDAVIDAFRMSVPRERIYGALLALVRIRHAAVESP